MQKEMTNIEQEAKDAKQSAEKYEKLFINIKTF